MDVHIKCDDKNKKIGSSDGHGSLSSNSIDFTVYLGHSNDKSGEPAIAGSEHRDEFRLSIDIAFKTDVNGDDLYFGNDFDKPIRDILPYGFSWGLALFRRLVDPSVDGDVYSDQPYLYGYALTSFTQMYEWNDGQWVSLDKPDIHTRRSEYMDPEKRKKFTFKKDCRYYLVFATPYLEITDHRQAILLPGFSLDVSNITCDQPLRYTLKLRNGSRLLSIEYHKVEK